ncbi:MAG: GNAT family N-acetyltransferase [Deltaproteobacteria bacterium]|nr:GNAT family N-acetyltransferase [Deltaproteobacteria bacterium]
MENDQIKIKFFTTSDADACYQIRSDAFTKIFHEEIGANAVTSAVNAYLPENFVSLNESIPIFVAFDGEEQVGFIASRFIEDKIEILFLYIGLDQLRKGIGVKLVEYFENWIKGTSNN